MSELRDRVLRYNREVKEALQTVYDALNAGQRKKLAKVESIRTLFERYGVKIGE